MRLLRLFWLGYAAWCALRLVVSLTHGYAAGAVASGVFLLLGVGMVWLTTRQLRRRP